MLLVATVIIGFVVAGGAAPDGDLPPGTPIGIRLIQSVLGLAIVGLMTTIFGWVVFGPGTRQFRVIGVPWLGLGGGELAGRALFGIGAALMAAFFVVMAVVSWRRLRDSQKSTTPGERQGLSGPG